MRWASPGITAVLPMTFVRAGYSATEAPMATVTTRAVLAQLSADRPRVSPAFSSDLTRPA